ncbi:MAG: invasion associated locus B family protein [Micropepsaceae bacterium]
MKRLFETSTLVGIGAVAALIWVSVLAFQWSRENRPDQGPRAVRLPPVQEVAIEPGFVGKQGFGLWTLSCHNVQKPGEETGKRLCLTNAKMTVRGPNNTAVLAAGFNVVMMNNQPAPGILFVLPLGAKASDSVSFAIDKNTAFKAPIKCNAKQCLVQGALPAEAVEQLRAGQTLSLVYTVKDRQQQDRKVRIDQLLHGFRQSFDAMSRAITA